jgi:hypothetical protein
MPAATILPALVKALTLRRWTATRASGSNVADGFDVLYRPGEVVTDQVGG